MAGKSIPVPIETGMLRKSQPAMEVWGSRRTRRPAPRVVMVQPIQMAQRQWPVFAQTMPTSTAIAV
jgi:hypothetical protein